MEELLADKKFDIISTPDKDFIVAFDKAMNDYCYDCGGVIGSGKSVCPYIITYKKTGVKNSPFVAQIFIGNKSILLQFQFKNRMDFNTKMYKHREYIENAPEHIKNVFVSERTNECRYCKEICGKYLYTIDGHLYEKCGAAFDFVQPSLKKLPDYIELLSKFYSKKS